MRKAEVGVMHFESGEEPPTKECRWSLEAEKGKKKDLLEPLETKAAHSDSSPARPSLDFPPPRLEDNKRVLFSDIRCVAICSTLWCLVPKSGPP